MTYGFALEQAFTKPMIPSCFIAHYSNTKMNLRSVFPEFSSNKMTLCNNNDQTVFSDTLTSARPLRGR